MFNDCDLVPPTLSVFYEADEQEPVPASSSHFTEVKSAASLSSNGVIPVRQIASNESSSQQLSHARGYLGVQPQALNYETVECLPEQMQEQEECYLPYGLTLTPQQREYLLRRAEQFSMNSVYSVGNEPDHTYSRTFNYVEQPSVSTCPPQNMTVPMIHPMAQQQYAQRCADVVHHVAVPTTQSGYSNAVHPQVGYSMSQGGHALGVHYSRGPVAMQYEAVGDHIYNNYATEEPTVYMAGSSMYNKQAVPMQRNQLAYTPAPVEVVVESNNYANDINFQDRREVVDGIEAGDDALTKRQRRPKRKIGDLVEDGLNSQAVQAPKRRCGRRKKLKPDGDGAEFQPGNTNTDEPVAPLTHGELLKQKKKNMAFPKGTFLIRYADLDSDEYAGHIWLVDNHQLLQKYTYDGLDASGVRVFSRTERYSGWLCNRPWLYHPLSDVTSILGNMEKVSIRNHPTRDQLFARRDEESKKAPEIEPEQIEVIAETGEASDGEHSFEEHEQDASTRDGFEDEVSLFTVEEPPSS